MCQLNFLYNAYPIRVASSGCKIDDYSIRVVMNLILCALYDVGGTAKGL